MRYPASEENRIISCGAIAFVARRDSLGIPRATFYRWYEGYREGGSDMLTDHRSRPERVSAKTRTGDQKSLLNGPRGRPHLVFGLGDHGIIALREPWWSSSGYTRKT